MALKLKTKIAPNAPIEVASGKPELMIDSLNKFHDEGGELFLIKKTTQEMFRVLKYSPLTARVELVCQSGVHIAPRVGHREEQQYEVMWR